MTHAIQTDTVAEEPGLETGRHFNVVIAYDTPSAATEAIRSIDRAVAHAGEHQVHRHAWRFDAIELPEIREEAWAKAAQANLLILVARGDTPLPASVRNWVEGWASHSTDADSALMALFHGATHSAQSQEMARQFLQTTARRAGHDFFSHELEDLMEISTGEFETSNAILLEADSSPVAHHSSSYQYREWGLNE